MPKADLKYRLDPLRSIEIFGVFDEQLADRILPRILLLRKEAPTEPVTVLINSGGGMIRVLELIEGALKSHDQDNTALRVITVAVGDAGSAAANLLTFGHYAISYPNSVLHYHGVRVSEVEVSSGGEVEEGFLISATFSASILSPCKS